MNAPKEKAWRGIKKESHKPHGKLSNPNPVQTPEFKEKRFKPLAKLDLGEIGGKGFNTRYPIDVEQVLLELEQGDRIDQIRKAVTSHFRITLKNLEEIEAEHGTTPDNIEALTIGDRFVVGDGSVWEVWEDGEGDTSSGHASERLYRLLLLGNKGEETEGGKE
ncbi:MAG: hypothetical protein J7647_27580 [Cyanobacteria bacterium SBLK]|nr:hypothetical protein [Cyanobacteria bacterium SBLK]